MPKSLLIFLATLFPVAPLAANEFDDLIIEDKRSSGNSIGPSMGANTKKKPRRNIPEALRRRLDKWTAHFIEDYQRHLKSRDWVIRSLALVSLSRIDDRQTTDILIKRLKTDPHPLVKLFAWTALWQRNDLLKPAERKEWFYEGMRLATRKKLIYGKLRVGLLKVMEKMGPTKQNLQYFLQVCNETNLRNAKDVPVLLQLRNMVGTWKCAEMKNTLGYLVKALGQASTAYRAEFILRGLGVPDAWDCHTVHSEGERLEPRWALVAKQYSDWIIRQDWDGYAFPEDPFAEPVGKIAMLDDPEIVNPDDEKWRKELEMPNITVDNLSLCVILDATGSMQPAIDWVRSEISCILSAMKFISREPRIGLTAYRDEGEEFVTKLAPLSSSGTPIVRILRTLEAEGGGDYPEAVTRAVMDTIAKQPFPKNKAFKKILVLVADAPPHRPNYLKLQNIVKKACEEYGFRLYCLKVRNSMDYGRATRAEGGETILSPDEAYDELAELGGGTSFEVDFSRNIISANMVASQPVSEPCGGQEQSVFKQLAGTLIRDMINKEYHDRVDPFVNVLIESLDRSPEEMRKFKPKPKVKDHQDRGGGGGRRDRDKNKKTKYKQ